MDQTGFAAGKERKLQCCRFYCSTSYRLSSHSTSASSRWNDSLLELAVDIDSTDLADSSEVATSMNSRRIERGEIRARTGQLLLENIVLCFQTSIVFLKTIDCVRAFVEMIGIGVTIVFVQFKLVFKLFDLDSILEQTTTTTNNISDRIRRPWTIFIPSHFSLPYISRDRERMRLCPAGSRICSHLVTRLVSR